MLDDFYPYAKDYLGFDKDASINFASDVQNAKNPLGKTAYYDPSNYSVTVYTDNRHPKDIMRSVSHELVHHTQNCRGDLGMSENAGEGYAQNDEHLREMEREAYEKGNLCFRDWEDGVKANLNPATIYEQKISRSNNSMQNFKKLTESFQSFLSDNTESIETELNEMRMGEMGKVDAEDGLPPTKIGRGNEEYMAAYNAVLQARGEEPLDIQQPDQAYLDALRSGKLEERAWTENDLTPDQWQALKDIKTTGQTSDFSAFRQLARKGLADARHLGGGQYEFTISKNAEQALADLDALRSGGLEEYGDHETQARGGMVSSTYSSDPEMDQIEDIAVEHKDWGLLSISNALKEQGFDVTLTNAVLVIDNKYFMGKPEKFDTSPDEEVREIEGSPLVLGRMSGQMEEGFRDSDEEKEMMAKMSNKELYKYLTRDRHVVPNLKGDMGPIDGMEGPFQYKSGAVLYYDPKAGKYYDRGKDMYLDNEEASKLTMENDTMESNNTTSLREKVKTAVMSKLSEMFDDDDMYGDEDPYMAGLEAEFPWLQDKKPKRMSKSAMGDDDAAMAAAARDAAAAGEFQSDEEEEMEEPTVMNETYDDKVYDMADKVVDALGYTDTLDNLYKAMDRREFLGNLEYISRMNDIDIPEDAEDDRWNVYDMVREAMGDEQFLQATLQAMSTEDATQTLDFIMRNYGIGEGEDDMYETTLRDRVMKRVQEVIGQTEEPTDAVVNEDASDETFAMLDKLTSGMSEQEALEAVVQALDVDTARGVLSALIRDYDLGGAEEMDEAKGKYDDGDGKEEKCDFVDCEDEKEVKEETVVNEEAEEAEEVEEVEEAIAGNPEDFYRQLRNESRVVNRPEWSGTAKSKRSSILNERLMKAWFNK